MVEVGLPMNTLGWLFVAAVAAGLAVQLILVWRQRRHILARASDIPSSFAADVSVEDHHKAVAYTVAKLRLEVAGLILGAGLLLVWTLGGGIDLLDRGLATTALPLFWQGVALIAGVLLVSTLLELPLVIWRTFGVESSFGFNRTTPARFVMDRLLGLILALVLGGPLLITVLWLMDNLGDWWWSVAWVLWISFTLVVTWAYPRFIAPLFNTFSPLQDTALRERLENLLNRCGFRANGLFVMDGSKRSAHANAFFTGFGKTKRVVFFDTLLEHLEPPELEAILAHELGHFRKHHIQKGLATMAGFTLAGLALLGWLAEQSWFYEAFGISRPSAAVALLLFLLVTPVFMELLQPLFAALSRKHEFEADAFAAEYSDPGALVRSLIKLYRDNASVLVSDPLYAAYHFSHPPPAERVARLSVG